MLRRLMTFTIAFLVSAMVSAGTLAAAPTPPTQPVEGPGGAVRPFAKMLGSRHGAPPTGYWLFEPAYADDARSTTPLPLVVFLHGFSAVNPAGYGAWIEHIVRGGAVVVYPDYQTLDFATLDPEDYLANAVAGYRAALALLAEPGSTPIDPARVAFVGHSVGGVLTANLAAVAAAEGLPAPRAMMPVEPGGCRGCGQGPEEFGVPLLDLDAIPANVLALVVVGADDLVVGDGGARAIWDGLDHLPLQQRDYVVLSSDDHGEPPLLADHFVPLGTTVGSGVDALDWFGLWKPFDLLLACAFDGEGCDVALGGSALQRGMGSWSDGTPVAPLLVADDPVA